MKHFIQHRFPLFLELIRCRNAVAAVEFAILLPLLLLLLTGTVEITRLAYLHQKLDKVDNAMADLATQGNSVSQASLRDLVVAADHIMSPLPFTGHGSIVFSSVATYTVSTPPCMNPNTPCVTWQFNATGADASRIGGVGSNPSLPGGYSVVAGQNVIVAEVFYNYEPVFDFAPDILPTLNPQTFYKIAVYKPRQNLLTTLN